MLKVNASVMKKVGMPDFGSKGASVTLELELDARLIEDPATLRQQIRRTFDLVREEVDAELARPATNGTTDSGLNHPVPAERPGNGHREVRPATHSQIKAIRSIAARRRLDADAVAQERFGAAGVDDLTLQEASSVIDALKAEPVPTRNGGTR